MPSKNITNTFSRAWYRSTITLFVNESSTKILGELTRNSDFAVEILQRDAWLSQIKILQEALAGLCGQIFLEFNIPRMGRRIDAVLLINSIVFVIEFKVGEMVFDRSAIDQVWDYALDLKNFHKGSHTITIVPILVATEASEQKVAEFHSSYDKVYNPILTEKAGLRETIDQILATLPGSVVDSKNWETEPYQPTPTIIEAARLLYDQHSVEAIARSDASAQNLRATSRYVEELIEEAQNQKRKIICFVTGVPGAGKTLVGLNIATKHRRADTPTHAVFLSGNGPLVEVLCEALTRDEVVRRKKKKEKIVKKEVSKSVKAFIQNVHHFRDEGIKDHNPPFEHVVIFDEAQRAWNLRQTVNFMLRKKGIPNFTHSEPAFLISYMDRHADWAVVICLVGGGQEINIGEAGITEWLHAVEMHFPQWDMYVSSKLTDSEYAAKEAIQKAIQRKNVHFEDSLHLAVSMRSFRAENVSAFVKALLDCEKKRARVHLETLLERYPIVITRELKLAKQWIKRQARGSERFGMVASSKAQRLRPHAIDIRIEVDPVHWFLDDKQDVRSSFYMEEAATEFQVQGLELDWVCVNWDGDFRYQGDGWSYHDFRGSKWTNVNNEQNQNYLKNAYRVILTRARQGMVVFVPEGEASDHTRSPDYYDSTFKYLVELGIPLLD